MGMLSLRLAEWLARSKGRPRKHLQRFLKTGRYRLQCGTPDPIQKMLDQAEPRVVKEKSQST